MNHALLLDIDLSYPPRMYDLTIGMSLVPGADPGFCVRGDDIRQGGRGRSDGFSVL